jgi:hypothetical protein
MYNNSLESKVIEIQNRIAIAKARLENAHKQLALAEESKSNIDINNYPYIVEETKYGGEEYEKAMNAAKQTVELFRLFQIQEQKFNFVQMNSVNELRMPLIKSEEQKKSIGSKHYPYFVKVNPNVSTPWWRCCIPEIFWETRYDGPEDSESIIIEGPKFNATDSKQPLQQANENLKQAQISYQSININNYLYTVKETKYGGEEYEKAIFKANEALKAAQIYVESCQEVLDMALEEQMKLLEEIAQHASNIENQNTDIQNADTQNIDLFEQEFIDNLQIQNMYDNQIQKTEFIGYW